MAPTNGEGSCGSNDLSIHVVEPFGNNCYQQIKIKLYPNSPLFISTGVLPRVCARRMK